MSYKWEYFSNIDLNDNFFTSLKIDYKEFVNWFNKKSTKGEKALIYKEENIKAFVYLKKGKC